MNASQYLHEHERYSVRFNGSVDVRRQLETNYQAGLSFGFRYRFGSIYNNIVNTRFGGGGSQDRF